MRILSEVPIFDSHFLSSDIGLSGGVYNGTFIDYGATRNRILEIVAALPIDERPVFTLMLSADETVRNAAHMRAFLADMRYAFGSMHGATPVVMRMTTQPATAATAATSGTSPQLYVVPLVLFRSTHTHDAQLHSQ